MTALLTMWDADVSLSGRLVLNGADIQVAFFDKLLLREPFGFSQFRDFLAQFRLFHSDLCFLFNHGKFCD